MYCIFCRKERFYDLGFIRLDINTYIDEKSHHQSMYLEMTGKKQKITANAKEIEVNTKGSVRANHRNGFPMLNKMLKNYLLAK